MISDILVINSTNSLRTAIEHLSGTEAESVLRLVLENVSGIEQFLKDQNPRGEIPASGMCLASARYVNQLVKQIGKNSRVLEGDLEIAPNHWLEHYLSLIDVDDRWILVDFTVAQLERYRDVPFVVIVSPQNQSLLLKKLSELFNWWIAKPCEG